MSKDYVTDRNFHVWQFAIANSDMFGISSQRHCASCGQVEYVNGQQWTVQVEGDGYCRELLSIQEKCSNV